MGYKVKRQVAKTILLAGDDAFLLDEDVGKP